MSASTSETRQGLTPERRRERVAELVRSGQLSPESAALIGTQEPTEAVRAHAAELAVRHKDRMAAWKAYASGLRSTQPTAAEFPS